MDEVDKNTEYRKNNTSKSTSQNPNPVNLDPILQRLNQLEATPRQPVANTQSATPSVYADETTHTVNLTVNNPVTDVVFYVSTPNPAGFFDADQVSDSFRQTVSLYKFTINSQAQNTAAFEFFSDQIGTNDSINSPKTFIEPACYETNDAFSGASKIITLQPGTAEKRDNKWIITSKAKITYQ
ncbi:hypothetical protein [Flavobacterium akiainvivens]|nr:hypothetical protein [Flavobacterium akiainvivens]